MNKQTDGLKLKAKTANGESVYVDWQDIINPLIFIKTPLEAVEESVT